MHAGNDGLNPPGSTNAPKPGLHGRDFCFKISPDQPGAQPKQVENPANMNSGARTRGKDTTAGRLSYNRPSPQVLQKRTSPQEPLREPRGIFPCLQGHKHHNEERHHMGWTGIPLDKKPDTADMNHMIDDAMLSPTYRIIDRSG